MNSHVQDRDLLYEVIKEQELLQQIANATDISTIADARVREKEQYRQSVLHRQLALLREGTLFLAPDKGYSPLEYTTARITALTERIARLQAALDANVKEVERVIVANEELGGEYLLFATKFRELLGGEHVTS